MGYLIFKTGISAILIVAISEIARRNTLLGGILASVPLVSVLAILWIYWDTQNIKEIISLSHNILWMIIPSLVFFIVLPVFLQHKINFYTALFAALGIMLICYSVMVMLLRFAEIRI